MCIANTLITLAQRMAKKYKPDMADSTATSKLQQFAANLNNAQLKEAGVPPKYWSILRKLNKVNESHYLLFFCCILILY